MRTFAMISTVAVCFFLLACGGREPEFGTVEKSSQNAPSEDPVSSDGGPATVTEDISVVETMGEADILFVIDNSGSMQYEQKNMADRFRDMISILNGIDWQVAITTTETGGTFGSGGRLLPFDTNLPILDSSMDPAVADVYFRKTIQRSEVGDDTERGITAVRDAIDRIDSNTSNTQFFRDPSHLSVVIISDEDESFELFNRSTPNELLKDIEKQWNGQKSFTAHSIITQPDDYFCLNQNGARFGSQYAKLSSMTGGIVGSVCETDYAKQLTDIGKDVVKKSMPTVELTCDPIDIDGDDVVDVLVDGEPLAQIEYMIDGVQLSVKKDLDLGDYKLTYYCAPAEGT